MMKRYLYLIVAAIVLSGCGGVYVLTQGEKESGYTYVPIDPFAVDTVMSDSCKEMGMVTSLGVLTAGSLLTSLPDNAVRMLVEQVNASGSVTYGVSKLGAKGETFRVTVDYINADTVNVPVLIQKTVQNIHGERVPVPVLSDIDKLMRAGPAANAGIILPNSEQYQVMRKHKDDVARPSDFEEFNIPVYIGIGLRVLANVNVVGANANIAGIGIIGAEAEAEKLAGSLVVQTLGVNGKSISAALPIQSELNRTTAQNAIVAVGSIKALLYEDDTVVFPRVVGLYLPFPGGKPLVNALISELSRERVEWPRPCLVKKK